ncbi:SLC13 family permease [Fontivita pretiosa]|uniref:SLC13 family permease n=1 Tax=Fontivita pretiosa TaxID=2989684 RepID=UPI003D18254A
MKQPEDAFEKWRRRGGLALAPIFFTVTYAVTAQLNPEGRRLTGILAVVAVLWVSEALPLPATALLGAVLCILLGVAPAKQVLAHFADPIVFVFIGSFMLARAMTLHGLDRRIALAFLSNRLVGGRAWRMLAGMGVVTALISMWVSNTATAAMMLPIALGVLGAMGAAGEPRQTEDPLAKPPQVQPWSYATGMMLMVAYAASIGGIGTPVGSPPNLIGIGLIEQATGVEIGFFRWMMLCVPLLAVMAAALILLLCLLHPANDGPVRDASVADYIRQQRRRLGPWTAGQINTLLAFAVAVALWIAPGMLKLPIWGQAVNQWGKLLDARVPEAVPGLLGALLLFVLPIDLRRGRFTLSWEQAVQIDWGTILLFGGGLALGTLMFQTGVAEALGQAITGRLGVGSLWALTGVSIAMGIVLSEATSNTAAANMVIPVVIGICQTQGINPIAPALGACLGASYGFVLPVSTPPNAIVYGSGLVPLGAMMRAGIIFDIVGFLLIWAGLRILCPLLGLA